MNAPQAQVFSAGEGDAWLARNRAHLQGYDLAADPVAAAVAECGLQPRRILDYGCSLGTRLSALCATYGANGAGVEPSAQAIAAATARDPDRTWVVGTLDAHPPLQGTFDLVILSFVLHWVDRRLLLASLANLDRHVADGGCIVLADFLPDHPQRREYHHLAGQGVFTYKNDYPAMLAATGVYRLLLRRTLAYPGFTPARPGPGDRAVVAVLERITPDLIPQG
jgi:SAM-dependent methyltransferase